MTSGPPASLAEFVRAKDPPAWTVQITNRSQPVHVKRMVEDLFEGMDIETTEGSAADRPEDVVVLLRDGEVHSTSPLAALRDSLLMVNSDLYKSGAIGIEDIEVPDIIAALSETAFTLRGYPESNTEKLVLTLVARAVEARAATTGDGTLRTCVQRLSRLDDERGTLAVYERLGRTSGLDVHLYGVPDWEPPSAIGLTVHPVTDGELPRTWFVVYRSDHPDASAGMVATRTDDNQWTGYWTFDDEEVRALDEYIAAAG